MMNKSKIEWCDRSWNPITGCKQGCSYCYAIKQSQRFCGDIRLNKSSPQIKQIKNDLYILENAFKNEKNSVIPMPAGFSPTLHKYRLNDPMKIKKVMNIFVGSMADVFGAWVPMDWLLEIFHHIYKAPWHRYLFLTKNPIRYQEISDRIGLPTFDNFWYGSTVTSPKSNVWDSDKHNTFLSIEPLLEPLGSIGLTRIKSFNWIILGAESGSRRDKVIPKEEWIKEIVDTCKNENIPLFMKNNLAHFWSGKLFQEFPIALLPAPKPLPKTQIFIQSVRKEKLCYNCSENLKNKSGWRVGNTKYLCPICLKKLKERK